MSIPCCLAFYRDGVLVDTFPQNLSYGTQQTPFNYAQSVLNTMGHPMVILRNREKFDSIGVSWPDGTKYTWEAILIRTCFKVPQDVLDLLLD